MKVKPKPSLRIILTVYDRSTTLGQKDAEINSSNYTHMSPEAMKKIADADEKLFNRKTL